jgi:hypothetical protein
LSLELRIPTRSTREGLRPLTALMCWPVQDPWVLQKVQYWMVQCTVCNYSCVLCTAMCNTFVGKDILAHSCGRFDLRRA